MTTVASRDDAARGEVLHKALGILKTTGLIVLAVAWVGIGIGAAVVLVSYLW